MKGKESSLRFFASSRLCGERALRLHHKDAKTRRGFWSKEFSMGTRIAACGFGLFFVLGCCSATRPGGAQSNSRGAEALRSGDYDKARAHFEDALKSRAEDEANQAGLLQVLRETGQYREALKRGIEFLKARENSAKLQLEMGRSFKAAGDLGGAEQHLRRATQLGGPARLDSVRELGFLLEETGRRSEAEGLWQRTVEGDGRRTPKTYSWTRPAARTFRSRRWRASATSFWRSTTLPTRWECSAIASR